METGLLIGMIFAFVLPIIIGIGFIIGSIEYYKQAKYYVKNGKKTSAVITYSKTDRYGSYVTVEYRIDEVRYKNRLETLELGMRRGKTVPILYIPDDPNKIMYAKRPYLPFLLMFIIGFLALIGGPLLALTFFKII